MRKYFTKPPRNTLKGRLFWAIFNEAKTQEAVETIRHAEHVQKAVDALYTFVTLRALISKYAYNIRWEWFKIVRKLRRG